MRVSYGVRVYIPTDLDEEIISGVEEVVDTTADTLVDRTKQRIVDQNQVDTGQMLGSVEKVDSEDGNRLTKRVIVGAKHGIYQELGTHKMAAKPFLGPEVDTMQSEYEAAIAQVIK